MLLRCTTVFWVAWTVVRAFGLDRVYPLPVLMAFTPYVALAGVLVVLVLALARRWLQAIVVLGCVIALAALIAPRAIPADPPFPLDRGEPLTVMILNLRDGRADPDAVVELVRAERVDVLALVEVKAALGGLRAAGLERLLANLQSSPYSRGGGSALYSRAALAPYALPRLGRYPETPAGRLAIAGGRELDFSVQHPPHATRPRFSEEWTRRLRSLPRGGEGARLPIVLGDFNSTIDQSRFREVLQRGLRDAAVQAGAGLQTTYPVRPFGLLAIDHVLVDKRIGVAAVDLRRVPGSDHRALIARLRIPPP